MLFHFYHIVEVVVDQNPAAVFANNNFFALADFTLTLGRDGIETSAAGISHNRHNSQAVAVVGADAIV